MTTTLDPSLSVRGKIVAALKADAQLTAIVPAARIYPSKVAAGQEWPFIRVPLAVATAAELDGGSGSELSGVVHCFAKIGSDVLDPEARAATINLHIVRVLSQMDAIELDDGESIGVHATQWQVMSDPAEADAYHGIVSYLARAT